MRLRPDGWYVGSATGIVHADMTLTQSKVKVTAFELPKISEAMHAAAMAVSPLAGLSG